jgi:tetratricopeptide (TPR) repeat protein
MKANRSGRSVLAAVLAALVVCCGAPRIANATVDPGPHGPGMKQWGERDRQSAARAAVEGLLGEVDRALRADDLERALALLLKLQAALPGSSTVANNVGCVLAALGRQRQALDSFRAANDLAPDDAVAIVNVGKALVTASRFDEADRRIARWRDRIEEIPAVGFLLARVRLGQGRGGDARVLARKIAESNRVSTEAVFDAGNLLRDLDDEGAAERAFRRATRLDPGMSGAWMSLLEILTANERIDEAEALCHDVLRRFPDHPVALFYRGRVHLKRGRREDAARDLDRAKGRLPASMRDMLRDLELEAAGSRPGMDGGPLAGAAGGVNLPVEGSPPTPGELRLAMEKSAGLRPQLDALIWKGVFRLQDEPQRFVKFFLTGSGPGPVQAHDYSPVRIEMCVGEAAWTGDRRPGHLAARSTRQMQAAAGTEPVRRLLSSAFPGTPFEIDIEWLHGATRWQRYRAVGRPHSRVWLSLEGRLDGRPGPEEIVRAAASLARKAENEAPAAVLDEVCRTAETWPLRGRMAHLQAIVVAGDDRLMFDLFAHPSVAVALERGPDIVAPGPSGGSQRTRHAWIGGLPATLSTQSGPLAGPPGAESLEQTVSVLAGRYQLLLTKWNVPDIRAVESMARRLVPQVFPPAR